MNDYDELLALERIVNSQLKELEKFEKSTSSDAAADLANELLDSIQATERKLKEAITTAVRQPEEVED